MHDFCSYIYTPSIAVDVHCSNQSLLITSWLLQMVTFYMMIQYMSGSQPIFSLTHFYLLSMYTFTFSLSLFPGGCCQRAQWLHPPPPCLSHRACRSCWTSPLSLHRVTQGRSKSEIWTPQHLYHIPVVYISLSLGSEIQMTIQSWAIN